MKLSVILPCYNGAATIATQLDALTTQAWSDGWEVVVVNNGSTDHSMEIVKTYRDRLPHLHIVNAHTPDQPRLGVSHSYNAGIQAATGDAFVFCEADDQVGEGWLTAMGTALSQHDFVAGSLEYTRLNPTWLIAANPNWQQRDRPIHNDHPPHLPFVSGCNIGIQRSVYEAVGKLDESLFCVWDTEYCWRVQQAGYPLTFLPTIVMHYRLRHTLSGMYQQGYRWGKEYPLLVFRYQAQPAGWATFVQELTSLVPYVLPGIKLSLMSLFNIRRGRGGFAIWLNGLGFRMGTIRALGQFLLDTQFFGQASPRGQQPLEEKPSGQ